MRILVTGHKAFHNYGHFTFEDMKTTAFPELLKYILKDNKE